jgi:hypothetical protein
MALLKLQQTRSDGVGYIDHRDLYFGKFNYRARVHMIGAYLCSYATKKEDFVKRIKNNKKTMAAAKVDELVLFADWKNTQKKEKKSDITFRIEGQTASVFSNNLEFLRELESLGFNVDFTAIEDVVPVGIKYFVNEPKFKYRIYLKSKRVSDDFSKKLQNMFDRYEGSGTKISPSLSLKEWLTERGTPSLGGWLAWKRSYCSSHYFIEYNDESFITIFALTFTGMISRKYSLEKRPEST